MIQHYWPLLGYILIPAFILLIPLFLRVRKPKEYDGKLFELITVINNMALKCKEEYELKLTHLKKQAEFIRENNAINASNIDDFFIGQVIVNSKGFTDMITNKTSNTIEVEINKRTKEGVTHKQWFTMSSFNKNYKAK